VPRDHWLEDWEKHAIVEYYMTHPLDGYRRLTFMMLDEDVVAVSPSSVYRVLRDAEIIIQAAREKFPGEAPRIISDNGPHTTTLFPQVRHIGGR
jgi:hypothetical protein